MDVGECDLFCTGCEWVWVGVGECDHFLAGCELVWMSVTFFWLVVGLCRWVWVSAGFVTNRFKLNIGTSLQGRNYLKFAKYHNSK